VTPLPGALGGRALVGWRLDDAAFAPTWDSGEGAFRFGGRWSSTGVRAVYAALDPATAILEVAVHKGFAVLDTRAHVLTAFTVADPTEVEVVQPAGVPNPNWLVPGTPSRGQQAFGDEALRRSRSVVLPSVVSRRSWNLLFTAGAGGYALTSQEPFALDGRLNAGV